MKRREFILMTTALLSNTLIAKEHALSDKKTPALFFGHGNPMNVLQDNDFTQMLKSKNLQKPEAILMISAHWYPSYTAVGVSNSDELIYDFYGFPDELFEVQYPALNSPGLAKIIAGSKDIIIKERGLDHGTWSILKHLFPKADVPVMQLSINKDLSPREHFKLAKKLRYLRQRGVMIMGSGNITHNLSDYDRRDNAPKAAWAEVFDTFVKEALEERDFEKLINFQDYDNNHERAHPSLEHYLPLLYVIAQAQSNEEIHTLYDKFQNGSFSMRSFQIS